MAQETTARQPIAEALPSVTGCWTGRPFPSGKPAIPGREVAARRPVAYNLGCSTVDVHNRSLQERNKP